MRDILFLAALTPLLASLPARAATVLAGSCSRAHVQAAIDLAVDGDTVLIPGGTCTWTQGVSIFEKAITLQGAGMDRTVIFDNYLTPLNGGFHASLITVATKLGKFTRLAGFTLDSSVYTNLDPGNYNPPMIMIYGDSQSWRVDHLHLVIGVGHGLQVSGSTYGVIDHNTFDLLNWHFGMYIFHPTWGGQNFGDGSWMEPTYAGTEKAVYVEDNVFNGRPYAAAIDGWSGGRVVLRHNTLNNSSFANHGNDLRDRSMRYMEIYNNTVTNSGTAVGSGADQLRGGTFVIHDNTLVKNMPGYSAGSFRITDYRDLDSFSPWGKCDGTSPFDLNDNTTYDTGSHSGNNGSSVLMAPGKNWTPNQWGGYYVHNLTQGRSGLIIGNTSDTITIYELSHHTPVLSWNNGDSFKILKVIACMDQRGRGAGDRLSGLDPPEGTGLTPKAWLNQVIEPTYSWNNTLNGSIDAARISAQNPWRCQEGREYFNSPMPGYTPYVYPHPAVSGTPPLITSVAASFAALKVYPNPWRSDRHPTIGMTFTNFIGEATLKIFTISGHEVKKLDANNGVMWNLDNQSGDQVASGLYLYLIETPGGQKSRGKVAVIR